VNPTAVKRLLGALTGLVLLAGTAGCGLFGSSEKTFSASFDRTVGVYKNSDVRVLGVRIGHVTQITPAGTTIKVDMVYDAKYKVPADAKAVVVAPSIVSDRYVQLTPVWRSGPVLADKASLSRDRTAVPVELDQIYSALDNLNQALGPNGANRNGALSDLIKTSAANLDGNGKLLNSTLFDLSKAIGTLADNRQDLFGTVANLQKFTTTIANSDGTVRRFNSDLAQVSAQLAGQRKALAQAIKELSVALGEVATFVHDNKKDLTANITDLASVTSVLAKQKDALGEFADNSAVALSNLQLAYNPSSGTLDTRDNGTNKNGGPIGQLCPVLNIADPSGKLCKQLTDAVNQLQNGQVPCLPPQPPLPDVPGVTCGTKGAPPPGPGKAAAPQHDTSLGGILGSGR